MLVIRSGSAIRRDLLGKTVQKHTNFNRDTQQIAAVSKHAQPFLNMRTDTLEAVTQSLEAQIRYSFNSWFQCQMGGRLFKEYLVPLLPVGRGILAKKEFSETLKGELMIFVCM